ncbi:MAG: Ig-like domain-containing protein, partial [Bacteroidetes bacterium]|nr:Ig-like domain-containing protein [Bacteroidota bacterium]
MKKILLFLTFALTTIMYAQLEIVSVTPGNNTTNVPLKTTVTITFNKAISLDAFQPFGNVFTNINVEGEPSLINDSKTISMEVTLDSNTTYFTCISTCKALDGSTLTSPFITYFTTAASFPPYSISGTVLSGTTGVSPENAFVGIGRFN